MTILQRCGFLSSLIFLCFFTRAALAGNVPGIAINFTNNSSFPVPLISSQAINAIWCNPTFTNTAILFNPLNPGSNDIGFCATVVPIPSFSAITQYAVTFDNQNKNIGCEYTASYIKGGGQICTGTVGATAAPLLADPNATYQAVCTATVTQNPAPNNGCRGVVNYTLDFIQKNGS